jgi:hypothetical protein
MNCGTLAYDSEWQYPVITEKAAYAGIKGMFQEESLDGTAEKPYLQKNVSECDVVYLAFPWATMIDCIRKGNDKGIALWRIAKSAKTAAKRARKVITTCQHIHAYAHEKLFIESGVTDLFWSHTPADNWQEKRAFKSISCHPFQLYPAQIPNPLVNIDQARQGRRRYLFSFTGAKANQYYISESRNLIGSLLSDCPGAYIKIKEDWHYQSIVYDEQVNLTKCSSTDLTIDKDYIDLLLSSDFSLCPAGTGPNSIRLWESINASSIPVIIGDYLSLPPLASTTWDEIAIFIDDNPSSIKQIPSILNKLTDATIISMRRNLLTAAAECCHPYYSESITRLIFKYAIE